MPGSYDAPSSKAHTQHLRQQLTDLEKNRERVLDRLVETDSPSVISAYESRIARLEHEQRLIEERLAQSSKPKKTFEEMFELAMRFLSNPCKIWDIGRLDLRQAVLRLAFLEPLV